MVEKKALDSESVLKDIVESPYKYGFTTKIETEEFPKGININLINTANPATFGTTAKKLVIDVGAPS